MSSSEDEGRVASQTAPNKGLELTVYSVRCAPAFGSGSGRALDGAAHPVLRGTSNERQRMQVLSDKDLATIGVVPWQNHADAFDEADLLIGNGFSMNVTSVFSYGALFPLFLAKSSAADQAALTTFNTTNFEFILEDLSTTARVNSALGLPVTPVTALATHVREGLIKTVEDNHPRKHAVNWPRLESIATELNAFGDIYTLNYDVLLYHIIMICKDRYVAGGRWKRYNDYFWSPYDADHLQFMDYQDYKPYNHVYYLHGALFLFKVIASESMTEVDVKLRTGASSELIDAIAAELRSGTLPLFVSEGRADEKQRAISRSRYLRFANQALSNHRSRLVIYGASLSDQDEHIAQAIYTDTTQAAVAIYPVNKTAVQLDQEMNLMKARLPGVKLVFFDSRTLFA